MRLANSMKIVCVALFCASLMGGCAQNRSRDRSKILAAENTDLRQRTDTLNGQLQGALSAQDRAAAEAQAANGRLQSQAQLASDAQTRAAQAEAQAQQAAQLLAQQQADLQRLQQENQRLAARPKVVAPPQASFRESPEVDALRRDISDRLARAGVSVPVEVRTTRSGDRKVAVVLEDAYPSGKDSLDKNPKAVEALARLSQVLQQTYPGSRIHIEGHTDSDPIRVSKWPSNEALSLARADQVKKLLVSAGLSEGQIETEGVGARNPLAKGGTPRAKAQNRRVEIYVSPR